MRLPANLQEAIDEQVAGLDRRAVDHAARDLSDRYRRGDFRSPVLASAAHRAAYLQTRMPATYAAILRVFAEIRAMFPELMLESMLDLGTGPGTAMWAAVDAFPSLARISLVERDLELLKLGQALARKSEHPPLKAATWIAADLLAHRPEPHDLVVIAYALSEIPQPAVTQLINAGWQAAGKLLVLVEPGTPRSFETVLAARHTLIAASAQVLAPCPHHEICPLAAAHDWCHFAVRVERTAEHRRLKRGELGYEDEKFSYLVASRIPGNWPRARVVRHPLFRPGHVQLTLCTSAGLQKQIVGKSQKLKYRAARAAVWGDRWD